MKEAIAALKAGDRTRAFNLLRRHLAENPKDATAWLWMSEATTEPQKQIDALKMVLRIAPAHPRAAAIRKRLSALNELTQAHPVLNMTGKMAAIPSPTPEQKAPPSSRPPREERTADELVAMLRGESLRAPVDDFFSPRREEPGPPPPPAHKEEPPPPPDTRKPARARPDDAIDLAMLLGQDGPLEQEKPAQVPSSREEGRTINLDELRQAEGRTINLDEFREAEDRTINLDELREAEERTINLDAMREAEGRTINLDQLREAENRTINLDQLREVEPRPFTLDGLRADQEQEAAPPPRAAKRPTRPAKQAEEVTLEEELRAPHARPATSQGVPIWVWIVMAFSLIIVAGFLGFLFMMTG